MKTAKNVNKNEKDMNKQESFEKLMGEFEKRISDIEIGDKITGEVIERKKGFLFLDLGGRLDGRIDLTSVQLSPDLSPGDKIDLFVTGVKEGFYTCSPDQEDVELNDHMSGEGGAVPKEGSLVSGKIKSHNSGGFEIDVEGISCFSPYSLMDRGFGDDPDSQIGKVLKFIVKESDTEKNRYILDRKELIMRAIQSRKEEFLGSLNPGDVCRGKVQSIKNYGVFIRVGEVEGLLHVSDIAYEKIEKTEEMFKENDEVKVVVKSLERDSGKISFSMKELSSDPWDELSEKFRIGDKIRGRVESLKPYGAFVHVYRGITGLVHISKLGTGKFHSHPKEVLKEGEEKDFWIDKIDPLNRKISLTGESPKIDYSLQLKEMEKETEKKSKNSSSSAFGNMLDKALGKK